jgi:autophagy-related protein 18
MRRTSANMTTTLVGRAAGYLPSSVTEIWEPQRDFAWVRVPRASAAAGGAPARCVVAMAHHVPHVMVATSEGEFLVYSVDLEKGGEGVLVKRFE